MRLPIIFFLIFSVMELCSADEDFHKVITVPSEEVLIQGLNKAGFCHFTDTRAHIIKDGLAGKTISVRNAYFKIQHMFSDYYPSIKPEYDEWDMALRRDEFFLGVFKRE